MTAPQKTLPEWAIMRVTRSRMIEVGLSQHAASLLTNIPQPPTESEPADPSIQWSDLVYRDGMLALAVLPDDKLALIANALRRAGAPSVALMNAQSMAHFFYAAASEFLPETPGWARQGHGSLVAASLLLRMAETAWAAQEIITELSPVDRQQFTLQ